MGCLEMKLANASGLCILLNLVTVYSSQVGFGIVHEFGMFPPDVSLRNSVPSSSSFQSSSLNNDQMKWSLAEAREKINKHRKKETYIKDRMSTQRILSTVSYVSTQEELNDALTATPVTAGSISNTISLTSNITLNSHGLNFTTTSFVETNILGNGFHIFGASNGMNAACFTVDGADSWNYVYIEKLTVQGCISSPQLLITGGAFHLINGGYVYMHSVSLIDHIAYSGSAVYVDFYSTLSLTDCLVSNNFAYENTGGITVSFGGHLSSNRTSFLKNKANGYAGAIILYYATFDLDYILVKENQAGYEGGGIAVVNSAGSLTNSVISYNQASISGGIGCYSGSIMTIEACEISYNEADVAAGGLGVSTDGEVYLIESSVTHNIATAGGAIASNSAYVTMTNSTISHNTAFSALTFSLIQGDDCAVGDGCFYSSDSDSELYNNDQDCVFQPNADGILDVRSFFTEGVNDYLTVNGVRYSGFEGPNCVNVTKGQNISWHSNSLYAFPGFEICLTEILTGGGALQMSGGEVNVYNSLFEDNEATRIGGTIDMDGGSLIMYDTIVIASDHDELAPINIDAGYFTSHDFQLTGNVEGNSAVISYCNSKCGKGRIGTCNSTGEYAPSCFVNCNCYDCPAGTYSDGVGASTDECSDCPSTYSSIAGSSTCHIAAENYYIVYGSNQTLECPNHATCDGASYYPRPNKNYWINRSSILDMTHEERLATIKVNKCIRQTCHAILFNEACWLPECHQSKTLTGTGELCEGCNDDYDHKLQCSKGAKGPLCGSCENGYLFQANANRCAHCDDVILEFLYALSFLLGLILIGIFIHLYYYKNDRESDASYRYIQKLRSFFNGGCLKVLWVTYQIVVSSSFTIDVQFPHPFSDMLKLLAILTFDFSGLECLNSNDNSYYIAVYVWCCFPIVMAICIVLVGILRVFVLRRQRRRILSLKVEPMNDKEEEEAGIAPSSVPSSSPRSSTPPSSTPRSSSPSPSPPSPSSPNSLFFRQKHIFETATETRSSDATATLSATSSMFPTDSETQAIINQHIWSLLFISYILLPPVSNKQLQAFDCLPLNGSLYLRSDTSINCDDRDYLTFRSIILMFVAIYQSIPIIWMIVLYQNRQLLNPSISNEFEAYEMRDNHPKLKPLQFLFHDYKCSKWWWEVVDIYRRILFIGLLPLVSAEGLLRSSFGCIVGIVSVALIREVQPYRVEFTNVIANVAQFTILLTYYAAFSILAGGTFDFGLGTLGIGIFLVMINSIVLIMVLHLAVIRYNSDRRQQSWRRALNTKEMEIVNEVMGTTSSYGEESETEGRRRSSDGSNISIVSKLAQYNLKSASDVDETQAHLIKQHLIQPNEVVMIKKIGIGAFGEVFKGTCLGEPVAIKTMIDVTPINVRNFRAEIILTAHLRHPNIVNFVGACWGRELMCLVLEWVAKGSLSDMLSNKGLKWQDPLLRFACDIARGMNYLHNREFYDEQQEETVGCIIHRDLKPDNVLISDFLAAKLADFGTSTIMRGCDVNLSTIGTPLYMAPEVARRVKYDEKVDVYSFGLMLIEMSVEEPILEFIGERYKLDHNKKKLPRNPMKLVFAMHDDGWRPVTKSHPISFAPPTINDLIIRCCNHDPLKRPSFNVILEELSHENFQKKSGTYGRVSTVKN